MTPVPGSYYDGGALSEALLQLDRPVQVMSDNFANGGLSLPGISIRSEIDFDGYAPGDGHFVPGAYTEYTSKYSETVWHFATPIYSFAGFWDLGAVDSGLEIDAGGRHFFLPDGLVPAQSWYTCRNQWAGFWGFVLTEPVDTVVIRSGDEGFANSFGQTYELSRMQVAMVTPEPGSLLPAGLALGLILVGVLRRSRNT